MLTISPPANITVAATDVCGQSNCAPVSYAFTVTGGYPPYNLVCNLPSGGEFLVGTHTISCLAQDSKGNSTPQASFQLTVTPPAGGPGSTTSSSSGGSPSSGTGTSSSSGTGTNGSPASGSPPSGTSASGTSGSGTATPGSTAPTSPLPTSSVTSPILSTTGHGGHALSFSVRLSASASLRVALVAQSGKTVMHFGTDAKKGRTRLTRAVPSVDVKKGSHLTLKVTIVGHGKTHTISIPVNP